MRSCENIITITILDRNVNTVWIFCSPYLTVPYSSQVITSPSERPTFTTKQYTGEQQGNAYRWLEYMNRHASLSLTTIHTVRSRKVPYGISENSRLYFLRGDLVRASNLHNWPVRWGSSTLENSRASLALLFYSYTAKRLCLEMWRSFGYNINTQAVFTFIDRVSPNIIPGTVGFNN